MLNDFSKLNNFTSNIIIAKNGENMILMFYTLPISVTNPLSQKKKKPPPLHSRRPPFSHRPSVATLQSKTSVKPSTLRRYSTVEDLRSAIDPPSLLHRWRPPSLIHRYVIICQICFCFIWDVFGFCTFSWFYVNVLIKISVVVAFW